MKLTPLAATVIVLAAFSAIAYFLTRPPASPSTDPRVGQPIVDRATIEKAAQLRLADRTTTVLLAKQPDASWHVASYYDLPADFNELSHFVDNLTNAKVQRFVTANPERLARLGFDDRRIALLDMAGHELWSLTMGKNADTGGLFIRFGVEQKAYLANLDASIETKAKNWVDSTLLNLKPADISKVEIGFETTPDAVVLRTKANASFTATTTPTGQQLATYMIDSLLNRFANLHFSDTNDPADPQAMAAKQHARTIKLTTFDGKTYTLAIGRKPEEKITKLSAAKTSVTDKSAATSETETIPAGPVYAFIACSDASAPVNALMQKRAYQISNDCYTGLPEKSGDLFVAAMPPAQVTSPAPPGIKTPDRS